jgi:hypothetical protein
MVYGIGRCSCAAALIFLGMADEKSSRLQLLDWDHAALASTLQNEARRTENGIEKTDEDVSDTVFQVCTRCQSRFLARDVLSA